MSDFLVYELKVAVALAVFSLFYRLLLSKETWHRFNRVVLLATSALAFILPFCVIVSHKIITVPAELSNSAGTGTGSVAETAAAATNYLETVLMAILFIGAAVMLFRTAYSIFQIRKLIAGGKHIPQSDGTTIVVVKGKNFSPLSWMKYIVMSEEDYSSTGEGILIHERAHIALGHSWDILFFDLMSILQWFNPAVWLLKTDLRALHEYEADEAVIKAGTDMREYQLLLVKKAVAIVRYPMANSLNHSTLKNRISMMLSKKSSLLGALKALYVIPLVAISLVANAETMYDYVVETPAAEPVQDNNPTAISTDVQDEVVPFQNTDERPTFNGGDVNAFSQWVATQLRYPEDAEKAGKTGSVYLSFTVTKEGNVKDVKVLRSAFPSLDAEAVRVVSSSPKWTPGKVKGKIVDVSFVIPVIYALRGSDNEAKKDEPVAEIEKSNSAEPVYVVSYASDNNTPLAISKNGEPVAVKDIVYIVNGELKENFNLNEIDTDNIASITIVKADDAKKELIAKYSIKDSKLSFMLIDLKN